jgi:hypothetical protein
MVLRHAATPSHRFGATSCLAGPAADVALAGETEEEVRPRYKGK